MKIAKALVAAAGILFCVAAFAQEVNDDKFGHYWFIGAGGGPNVTFDGQKFIDRPGSHIGGGAALDIYFGKWFSDRWGFRAGYQGLHTSDQYSNYGKYNLNYGHADLLLRAHKNIVPYAHAGVFSINKATFGGGLGIAFPIHLGKTFAIVPDLKATGFNEQAYNLGNAKRFCVNLSATLGIMVKFGRKPRKADPCPCPPAPVVVPVEKTVVERVVDTIYVVTKEPEPEIEVFEPQPFEFVYFDFDKYNLTPTAINTLNKYVSYLKRHPEDRIEIQGHTDGMGTDVYNDRLSDRRADAVHDYLVNNGVNPACVPVVKGYGKRRPDVSNDTAENRALNRRACLYFIPAEKK